MTRTFAVLALLTAAALLLGRDPGRARIPSAATPGLDTTARHLFYLHGRIIEDEGPHAVSPEHGRYEYAAIVRRFADAGLTVWSEARARDTDPEAYADSVARQVRRLVASGVPGQNVTVVGASKGSVIAMLVSTQVAEPIRYVLIANCNEYIFRRFPLQLHGEVLSIYEAGDSLGQSCRPLFDQSPGLGARHEIRLETGLRHGFIFRPLDAWVVPAIAWAERGADTAEAARQAAVPVSRTTGVSPELRFSSALGGAGVDDCDAIAVDALGAIYLGCHSDSPDLPGPGTYRVQGDFDAFVLKLSPGGDRVEYRAQVGGPAWEAVSAIAVGGDGYVYAVGGTYSDGLATTRGVAQGRHGGGGDDAFAARLDPAGNVVYLTYLGGAGRDDATGVAVDAAGNAYVVGRTASSDFPVSADAVQRAYGGETDAFLTKLSPAGRVVYSTFVGGSAHDIANAVALDRNGNVHVAGQTQSADFPAGGGLAAAYRGDSDGFVVVLDSAARRVVASALIGGSGWDAVNAMSLGPDGRILLTGSTRSTDFPVTANALKTRPGGGEDAFVVRLAPLAAAVGYATYLGGSGNESGAQVLSLDGGGALVVGGTESADFPVAGALQAERRGTLSGFLAMLDERGARLAFSTFLGGSDRDLFEDAAIHPDGSVVITGLTGSRDFPATGASARAYAGGWRDILVVRIGSVPR